MLSSVEFNSVFPPSAVEAMGTLGDWTAERMEQMPTSNRGSPEVRDQARRGGPCTWEGAFSKTPSAERVL